MTEAITASAQESAQAAAASHETDLMGDNLDTAAEALADTTSWFTEFFQNFLANLTWENALIQAGCVVVAFLLGAWLSRVTRTFLNRLRPGADRKGLLVHLEHVIITLAENVAFGFFAGSIVALCSYAMTYLFGLDPRSLIICRIFYNIFYAFSILSIVLACLQGLLGRHIVTPAIKKAVTTIFWALAVLQFFGVLGRLIDILDNTRVPIGSGEMTLWKLVMAIISVLLTLAVAHWLSNIAGSLIDGAQSLSGSLKTVLKRVTGIVLTVLAVIIGLGTVGIDLTILEVFGGALGVGLGFGLQNIASNYISGFIILLDKAIKIGDLVTVDGFKGKVTQINTRYTVVRSNDGIENIVPNETFVTSSVLNHTYSDGACIVYVPFYVSYDCDVHRALEIMLEEASRPRPRIVKDRKGWAYYKDLGDAGFDLEMGFWVEDPQNGTAGLTTEIVSAVYKRFDEEGIKVPYRVFDLVFRDAPATLRIENTKA
ncbi:mechanosensitive ion channel family protein [Sutterella sp.]|uniref:mechanosensitive ion channel family protein n=1 Tax=Sutterella sp. TaxID=1981025 RepID=UPI0026E0C066|nr:mechanosensitive ion channel domain-containing protein [Sutterella sp.]MDO5531674.1 mechanosensitive ion channel [Sutterella sp.]